MECSISFRQAENPNFLCKLLFDAIKLTYYTGHTEEKNLSNKQHAQTNHEI